MTTKKQKKEILSKVSEINKISELEKKIEALKLLESNYPEDVVVKQALSATYFNQKENTKAREYLEEALKIESNNFSINYNLGLFYRSMRNEETAIEYFKKSIELNKNLIEGYNALGDIYSNNGHLEDAIKSYKKSISINKPKQDSKIISRLAINLFNYGFRNRDYKNIVESISYFEICHKLEPMNTLFGYTLVNVYNALGMKSKAIKLLEKFQGVFSVDTQKNKIEIIF